MEVLKIRRNNYAAAFETLKLNFGNPVKTFHIELKAKFNIPQIKTFDEILKFSSSWSRSS